MIRNFAAIADGDGRAGKSLVRNGLFDFSERRLQLRFAAHLHRLQRHGIGRNFDARTGLQIQARNRDRKMPANRNLSEQSACHRDLCDIADAKRRKPGLRLGKTFNQVGAAHADGDDGFTGIVNLVDEWQLIRRNVHVALAVADTHEQSQDRDIVGIRRGKLQRVGFHKFCVGAKRGQGVKTRFEFALQVFSWIGLRVGVKRNQQRARRLRSIERQAVRRIAKQRNAPVGNIL